jgi:hypothetical protein
MGAGVADPRAMQHLHRSRSRTAAIALIASLVVTGGVVSLVCEPPVHPIRSWREIALIAAAYALLAFFVHAVVVWAVCRLAGVQERAGGLLLELWSWVAWLPLLALLTGERSIWVALVLPAMTTSATIYMKRRSVSPASQDHPEAPRAQLLQVPEEPPFLLTLLPMLLTSVLLQVGAIMLGARSDWLGGTLLAAASIAPVWRITRSQASSSRQHPSSGRLRASMNSVAVVLLLMLILLPFLRKTRVAPEVNALLHRAQPGPAPAVVHAKARTEGSGFSGIVLLLPAKPHERTVPQPPAPPRAAAKTEPIVIPFDGAYWYLKDPEDRPEPDARVVHGDPLKAKVRSTNLLPVLMKAHQTLPSPMSINGCTSLRVDLINAETRPGPVYVQVTLSQASKNGTASLALGKLLLPSSTSAVPNRPPVHDSLTFALPHVRSIHAFDEITVSISPTGERALTGSQISVQSFVLLPY